MKKFHKLFLLLLVTTLFSCEGSDTYQGKWSALDPNGRKFEITFSPTNFSIKDSTGKSKKYEYTQHSVTTENSLETYGIRVDDGRAYQIYFPKKDESVGIILDENGIPLFTISRKGHITYQEIYKLN
ncbi:hypothetical protein [Flavobacterium sp.]|uniref:hypothetical protein n=1 Tax=Flavobacterium sp. TaxID=239 RepID=UPI003D6BDD27